MDDSTKKMLLTIGAGLLKKGGLAIGMAAATHGWISGSQVELFGAAAVALGSAGYSLWNDYGKAILLSQLEVLKAKSLAQAAKLQSARLPQVTVGEIANQSDKLTPADVVKAVASLPPANQATVAPVKALVIFCVMSLAALCLLVDGAHAQTALPKIKPPQITGDVAADTKANFGLGGQSTPVSKGLNNILDALDEKLLPDLTYAKKMADATGSTVTAPCYQAWIDIINKRKTAVTNADGTPMDLPNPRLVTDFEKAVELRNALQPESDFMLKCSPVANMIKQNMLSFIGKVLAGGAGLATLVPGL